MTVKSHYGFLICCSFLVIAIGVISLPFFSRNKRSQTDLKGDTHRNWDMVFGHNGIVRPDVRRDFSQADPGPLLISLLDNPAPDFLLVPNMALFAQASLENRSMCTIPRKYWHGTIALGCGDRLGRDELVLSIWSSGRASVGVCRCGCAYANNILSKSDLANV